MSLMTHQLELLRSAAEAIENDARDYVRLNGVVQESEIDPYPISVALLLRAVAVNYACGVVGTPVSAAVVVAKSYLSPSEVSQ